jgi:hypothetical protein
LPGTPQATRFTSSQREEYFHDTAPTEDRIRDRAYALWQADGSPEHAEKHYWHRAERELADEAAVDTSDTSAEVNAPPLLAGLAAH